MAATEYKPYDQDDVESIRLMLEAEAKDGRPLCFDVKVNGNTRIHKTNKVERFKELHNFINENTKDLVITVYPDPENSNKKEWYKFRFGNISENLNGVVDVESKLNERMKAFEEQQAAKRMEEKLCEVQKELKEAEEYIRILEDKLEENKIKPNHFGGWDLGKLAASTIEGIAVHHPKILDKVPVLNGIAKVIQEDLKDRPSPQLNGSFEGDVSFKSKQAKKDSSEIEEHEETVQRLSDFIGEHFNEAQRSVLGQVIVELGEKPEQLQTVAELLGIDVNAKPEEENEKQQEN